MATKLPTPTNRAGVLIFQTAHRRRSGARLRLLKETYRSAIENQVLAAARLEEVLTELERASVHAEQVAWELSAAQQRRTSCLSFGEVMGWVADVCRLRNAGEHFCIAELVRSSSALEPRSEMY
jgi:hypothetical protein